MFRRAARVPTSGCPVKIEEPSTVRHDRAMSLRLLYLILQQVLGLILLMGRTSSTKDVELLVLRY
jgi:hypothetical protein